MEREPEASDRRLLDEVFTRALELSAADRSAFLDRRCAGDPSLRRNVESLLAAAGSPVDPIDQAFGPVRDRLLRSMLDGQGDADDDLCGQRIGRWLIARRIARGGLATVYLARRDDGEFEQDAAFKVLRRGLDTDDIVSRFRAERQILSSLEHPSIARILDGGALPDGRPYLVLEFVDGLPITSWCESRHVDLAGQLRLMIAVLRALHFAHKNLVVHRDVKPTNILVSGDGDVKLLDFGIAKLLDAGELASGSVQTRTGVALLTPGYGSPEQHAGRIVTTLSDVYQAGLVLYELLTGRCPFDGNPVALAFELPPPSAALRGTPGFRTVRGDLDAIVRKATRVDPAQRYASADEMVLDLGRFLDGRPVLAQPDTLPYRLRKLATRRPWLIPLAAFASLGLVAYVTTLTLYSNRLQHEQRLAEAAHDFMADLFRSPDPFAPADPERGLDIRVVEALDIGQRRVRSELRDQPELRAKLLASIADVYASLDQYEQAIELGEEALALDKELHGPESERVIEMLRALGHRHAMAGDLKRADALLKQQLELALRTYPDGSPGLALAQMAYGLQEARQGSPVEARALLLAGIESLRAGPGTHAQVLVQALIALDGQGALVSAPLDFDPLEEAEKIARATFGDSSLQLALVKVRRASSMTNRGAYEDSERNFLAALAVLEGKLGPEHSSTLGALNNLGYLYHRRGDLAGAERTHRELLRRNMVKHGPVHRAVGDSYQNLAGALTHQGRYDESLPLHRQAYEVYRAVLNADNYVVAIPLLSIAYVQLQRGDAAAAETAAREALRRLESVSAVPHLRGVARCLVGVSLDRKGREAEGAALIAESHGLIAGASLPDPYPELCRLPGRPAN